MVLMLLMASSNAMGQGRALAEFSVEAGYQERWNAPVSVGLQGLPLHQFHGELQLFEITHGQNRPVAFQRESSDQNYLTWILDGFTTAGGVRTFELRTADATAEAGDPRSSPRVDDDGESVRVSIGNSPVLEYRYAPQRVPEGVDSIYARGGFIHPLWSPSGQVLTRIQPPDHYHHYGIWNPWTHTEFEGREVDFWNLAKGEGTVRAKEVMVKVAGDVFSGFRALHSHVAFSSESGEQEALKEEWEVRVWHADPERRRWLIDFTSTQTPASSAPLTVKAYRYQGFSIRATAPWNDATATLLTSEGFDKGNANGTRARWVEVGGITEAEPARSGILFMTHPANFNFPEQLRIWPTGMNGGVENVFVNFNPAQEQDWVLTPGQTHTLKYRMLVYDGSIDPEEAERHWKEYTDPVAVKVHRTGALTGARVLVYTKNGEGYVHDNIPHSVEAIRRLAAENGFAVDASDDPVVFTDANLRRYDALVFSNTNNEAFDTEEQRRALQTYVRSGGGFVGIHSASGSERDWPWFSQLVGGNFVRHAPIQDFEVEVANRSHPSTSFLPDTWQIEMDECYYLDQLNPGIVPVLVANLTTVDDPERDRYPGRIFGDTFPIAWYQEFDGGRQWYSSLGHRPEHYDDPIFLRHVLGGIRSVVRVRFDRPNETHDEI